MILRGVIQRCGHGLRRHIVGTNIVNRSMQYIPSLQGMPEPLPYEEGRYNSASINAGKFRVEDTADFATRLFTTITSLQHQRKSALWLKVPIDLSHYIPIASHYGFKLHHTLSDCIVMSKWLLHDVPDKIPSFASHHVGVAGAVLDGEGGVLLVREKGYKGGPTEGWKFPGGLVDVGEDLGVAAAREVREETGVSSIFRSVVAFRHQHGAQFGSSDMFFVCKMALPEGEGDGRGKQALKPCSFEIDEVKWYSLEKYSNEALHPMQKTVAKMLLHGGTSTSTDLTPITQTGILPGAGPYLLYKPA